MSKVMLQIDITWTQGEGVNDDQKTDPYCGRQ